MSFIRRGVEARAAYPAFNAQVNPLNMLYGQLSTWSNAGERVDEVTALGVSTVLSAVSLLADSVASMPMRAYRGGEEVDLPMALADPSPNETTSYEYVHTAVETMALHGQFYSYISRLRGEPIGLTHLHPYQINVMPSRDYQGRMYLHLGRELPREDLLVARWFTPPQSLVGISPLTQQRTVIGLALAMDKYLSQWYGEGATPSGVLSTDRPLSSEAARNLRETWEGSHRKHRRPAVLSDGLKWNPISVNAVDQDYKALRDWVNTEVARIFRIPPHLMNVPTASSDYANVEQSSINYLTYTLHPWLNRLEIAFSSLFPGIDIRFDPSSLLRLDAMTKARVDQIKITSGTRTRNEARALDGEKPYDGGDEFVLVLPGTQVGASAPDTDPTDPKVLDV